MRPRRPLSPDGNERLTAIVGVVLLVPIVVELLTIPLGIHSFMSLHVFVGFVLIPLVLLKLASTGWRFGRYYLRHPAYRLHGAPQLAMRLLAPILVAATVVLFASGVAMGFLHGHWLTVARRLHGPASGVWIALIGLHVLVYTRRALTAGSADLACGRRGLVRGADLRVYLVAVAVIAGIAVGLATVPAQHRWINLQRNHRRIDTWNRPRSSPSSGIGSRRGTGPI